MEIMELIAPCHFGLEAVLKREIIDLGYEISAVEDGRVSFWGDAEAICRANVFLRTAERVMLTVGRFKAYSFDELFEQKSSGSLIDNEKNLPEIEAIEGPVYTLKPHTAYLASIKRKVKIPKGYTMLYLPRSTLLRSFVSVQTAVGDPGFYGTLMFMVYNHGDFEYKLKSGDRIAQAVVFPVEGSGEYDGSYQEEE